MSVPQSNWLLDEDSALKSKLEGFSVANYADGELVPVPIWFRYPDPEKRPRTFPHIQIDMIDIEFDPERAHRSAGYIQQIPTETATPASGFYLGATDMPLPWTIIYQLTAKSRQPRHDRQLDQFLFMRFPEQFGFLDMSNYDGTIRRADLRSHTKRDVIDPDRKRTYQTIITIGVSTEFYLQEFIQIQQVLTPDVLVEQTN
ncbi:MAG: hypothetical protein KGR26_13445 [Cyanobacteria bacterium REEB65]|nr:hypothetical protein [Cyanobacteria bacterium REEB65]